MDGNLIKWQKWHIRISFNYREGLVSERQQRGCHAARARRSAWMQAGRTDQLIEQRMRC